MRGGLIKSADAVQLAPCLAPLELRDVQRESESIRQAARTEAADLLRRAALEAREQAARAIVDARHEGRRQGLEQGLEKGRREGAEQALAETRDALATESASVLALLEQLTRRWTDDYRRLFVGSRQEVIGLAIAIARRVAPRLGALDAAIGADNCAAALAALGRCSDIVVRLHAEEVDAVRRLLPEAARRIVDGESVRWIGDPAYERGRARVESAKGAVDAALGVQVDRIADELLEGWRRTLAVTSELQSPVQPEPLV